MEMKRLIENVRDRLRLIVSEADYLGRTEVRGQYERLLGVYEQIYRSGAWMNLTDSDREDIEHWLAMTDPEQVVIGEEGQY